MRLRRQLLNGLVAAPALLGPSIDLERRGTADTWSPLRAFRPASAQTRQGQRSTPAGGTARPARARCVRCQRPAWTIAEDGAALCRTCAAV